MAGLRDAPRWRRVFLRELARSGNVAGAAEKAGIDRSSAYQLRRRNAAFAASWERAMERAREGLVACSRAHPRPLPQAGGELKARPPLPQAGGELEARTVLPQAGGELEARTVLPQAGGELKARTVPLPLAGGVRGGRGKLRLRDDECVRASKAGRPCVVRAGPGRWSVGAERAFLEVLTATANVTAAARAAGVSTVAAYNRRKRWPGFAAAWDEAIAEGYVRLETLLIGAATATLEPVPGPSSLRQAQDERGAFEGRYEMPEMTVAQAMNLVQLHRASQRGGREQRYGWRRQLPDIEEVRAEVARRLAALRRARGRG